MASEPQPQQLNKVQDCKWISCVLELERDIVVVWLYDVVWLSSGRFLGFGQIISERQNFAEFCSL